MYNLKNFTDNDDIEMKEKSGAFSVIEYKRDLSVTPYGAAQEYYASKTNVRRRQVICDLQASDVTVQSGAMQWSVRKCQYNNRS